jgi:hypothetical protein
VADHLAAESLLGEQRDDLVHRLLHEIWGRYTGDVREMEGRYRGRWRGDVREIQAACMYERPSGSYRR